MEKLIINNLFIKIENKTIVKQLNIQVQTGDVVAISGKNGAGKTSILNAIMNHYAIKKEGKITFNNTLINNLSTNEIAKLGFYFLMQNPPEIEGLKSLTLLNSIVEITDLNIIKKVFDKYALPLEILQKPVNMFISGGQKKKFEFCQIELLKPKVLLIDEVDAGLDKNTLDLIIQFLNNYRKHGMILIISHNQKFIDSLKPNKFIQL